MSQLEFSYLDVLYLAFNKGGSLMIRIVFMFLLALTSYANDLRKSDFLMAEINPDIMIECDFSDNPILSGDFVFHYIKIGILSDKKIGVALTYYSSTDDKIGAFARYSRSYLSCSNNKCVSKGPSGLTSFSVPESILSDSNSTKNVTANIDVITCEKYGDFGCFSKEATISTTVVHKFSVSCVLIR